MNSYDLIASSPRFPETFAIEVKRPTSEGAIERNLKKARKQLRERCKHSGRAGVAIVGIDRVAKLAGAIAHAADEASFRLILDREMNRQTRRLHALVQRKDLRLFPIAPFVGAVLVGTVFVADLGMPILLGALALRSTASVDSLDQERVDRMVDQLQST